MADPSPLSEIRQIPKEKGRCRLGGGGNTGWSMSGMYEYVGTARTFWVPWLTARGWGTVVWWYGGWETAGPKEDGGTAARGADAGGC